jgi:hypothetical protein
MAWCRNLGLLRNLRWGRRGGYGLNGFSELTLIRHYEDNHSCKVILKKTGTGQDYRMRGIVDSKLSEPALGTVPTSSI